MDGRRIQTIAIIGASGDLGSNACKAAVESGLRVVAVDRRDAGARADGGTIEFREANVLEDDLAGPLEGCDAVVSCIGLPFSARNAIDPPPLYSKGTTAIVEAMRRRSLTRLSLISAAFVIPQPTLPLWFSLTVVPALHSILEQMRVMEGFVLRQQGLDWTIVRPGWLLDEPARGDLLVGDGLLPKGAFRCRVGDVARFLVDATLDGEWSRRHPAIGAPDDPRNESPLALGRALAKIAH